MWIRSKIVKPSRKETWQGSGQTQVRSKDHQPLLTLFATTDKGNRNTELVKVPETWFEDAPPSVIDIAIVFRVRAAVSFVRRAPIRPDPVLRTGHRLKWYIGSERDPQSYHTLVNTDFHKLLWNWIRVTAPASCKETNNVDSVQMILVFVLH